MQLKNLPKLLCTAILLLTLSISSNAQKETNPVKDFRSPFKLKASTKQDTLIKPNNVDFKIDVTNGSFSLNLQKYDLTKEQIESSLSKFLNLHESNTFKKISEKTDDLGFTHIHYAQFFNNIPVDGAIILLHLKNGKPNSVNGQIATIKNLETTAVISTAKALEIAMQFTKVTKLVKSYPIELLIAQIPSENGFIQKLAYKVRIDANKPFMMCNVFVDAIIGKVVNKISLINDADVTATANTLYSGTQTITTDSYVGGYRLRNNSKKIETYNLNNTESYSNATDFSNSSTNWTGVPLLKSFTISSAQQSWWYTPLADELADFYITIKDGSNQVVYTSSYVNNTNPPVTFSNLNIVLNNPPYIVEVWDYDPVGGDDFGGSYNLSTTAGTQFWSGSGNSGSYLVAAYNNPALDAHWGVESVYDYYLTKFGRNSYDNNGASIKSYVHYGIAFNNAFWDGSVLSLGDGDGITTGPKTYLNVIGHEFTHGVVEKSVNGGLNYQGESGALNESFADIFGTALEFFKKPATANWLHGEEGFLIPGGFTRSLENPNLKSQPDTYNGTYWVNINSSQDHGGVHTNSGVQNFWFYLLCQGGTGTNDLGNSYTVNGIGIAQAEKIAYKNLTTYIPSSNATYYDSYLGSLLAAEQLYGNPSSQYTAVRQAWYAVGIGNDPNNFCSGTTNLTAATGSFTDGSGSANYNNNQNCKWVIAPAGATQITLNFTSFATEANYDTVFVYDGPNDNYPILMKWWGNTIPPTVSTSAGTGAMCVKFKTDATNTAAGWSATYNSIGTTPGCSGGNVLTTPTGTFTDGSGSANYGNNQLCYWLIAPPCATSVTLSLTQLNTEAGYDGVIVYNGNTTSAPLLGAFSGTTLPSAVTASSGQMLVVFTSDFSTTAQGFSASYTSTGSAYCSGTTTLNTLDYGTITDGSGNNNYCNNQNCSWLIQPPQATSITLKFTSFDVEPASTDGKSIYDAVEVYDGTSANGTLLGRFTGNSIPPAITANSGSMFVRFFSDIAENRTGWSANYISTSASNCNSFTTLTAPNGTFTDGSGTNQYANNTNCAWLIQPPNAGNIILSFSEFNTELNYDGVIVYNGADTSAPILGQFSGTTIPSPVTATGGSMYVRFLTDEALRAGGFTANYSSTTLPLNLFEFTATYNNNEVLLKWLTNNEVNTKVFTILRSKDGNTWAELGNVNAFNTSGTNNYSFKDFQPHQGVNYYRLKMIDKDGKFTYSPVRIANVSKNNLPFVIAPNPASSSTTIYFTQPLNVAEISVFDVQGKKILNEVIKSTGMLAYQLNANKLTAGVYIIQVKSALGIFTERLLINR